MDRKFSDFVEFAKTSETVYNGRNEAKAGMLAVKPDLAPELADAMVRGAEKIALAYLRAYSDWSER